MIEIQYVMNDKNFDKKKNERFREIMTIFNMNQVQMGITLEVDQPEISRMIHDKKSVGDSVCWKIVCKLNINPIWLETGDGDRFLDNNSVESSTYKEQIGLLRDTIKTLNYTIMEQKEKIENLQMALKNNVNTTNNV